MKTPFTFNITDDQITDDEVVKQLQKQGHAGVNVHEKKKILSAVIHGMASITAKCPVDLRDSLKDALPPSDEVNKARFSAANAAASFNSVGKVLRLWKQQNAGRSGHWPPGGNPNNNDHATATKMMAMAAVKKICDDYERCFQEARNAKLGELESFLDPSADYNRKYKEKSWTDDVPIALQASQCPLCQHEFIDGPAANTANYRKNLATMEEFEAKTWQQAADMAATKGSKKSSSSATNAGSSSTKPPKLQNPTIANKQLLRLTLVCHCHQFNNVGLGNNTCPVCLSQGALANRNECKICSCNCNFSWDTTKSQEIAVCIARKTLGDRMEEAKSQATCAAATHHALFQSLDASQLMQQEFISMEAMARQSWLASGGDPFLGRMAQGQGGRTPAMAAGVGAFFGLGPTMGSGSAGAGNDAGALLTAALQPQLVIDAGRFLLSNNKEGSTSHQAFQDSREYLAPTTKVLLPGGQLFDTNMLGMNPKKGAKASSNRLSVPADGIAGVGAPPSSSSSSRHTVPGGVKEMNAMVASLTKIHGPNHGVATLMVNGPNRGINHGTGSTNVANPGANHGAASLSANSANRGANHGSANHSNANHSNANHSANHGVDHGSVNYGGGLNHGIVNHGSVNHGSANRGSANHAASLFANHGANHGVNHGAASLLVNHGANHGANHLTNQPITPLHPPLYHSSHAAGIPNDEIYLDDDDDEVDGFFMHCP
jgi:hypothetical protein